MNKLKELTKNHYDSVMAVRGEISETLKKYSIEIKVGSEEFYDFDNNYVREYKVTSIGGVPVCNEDFRYHNGDMAEKMYKALTLIHGRYPEIRKLSAEVMYAEIIGQIEIEDLANEVDYEGENSEDSLLIACICYTHKIPPEEFYKLLEFITDIDSNLLPAEVCED